MKKFLLFLSLCSLLFLCFACKKDDDDNKNKVDGTPLVTVELLTYEPTYTAYGTFPVLKGTVQITNIGSDTADDVFFQVYLKTKAGKTETFDVEILDTFDINVGQTVTRQFITYDIIPANIYVNSLTEQTIDGYSFSEIIEECYIVPGSVWAD